MDVSTVSNAVNDALAGLPAGTSDFIKANIGTPTGQQAILKAGLSLGLSQAQIASAVSQATGMTVTPQQVAQVAQSIAQPASTPAPANISAPAPVPAQTGTSLSNITQPFSSPTAPATANPQEPSKDFQTTYNALQYGNAKVVQGTDADGNPTTQVVDGKSNVLPANAVQLPNGSYDLQIPSAGGIIHTVTAPSSAGTLQPIQDYNTQVQYTGGKSGSVLSNLVSNPLIQLAASVAIPGAAPIIAGANAINAASQGNFGNALLNAGIAAYTGGAFNQAPVGQTLANLDTGINSNPIGDLGNLGQNTYTPAPTGGEGIQAIPSPTSTQYATTTGAPSLQPSSSANLASMGGGQGLTTPTSTGSSVTPNATLGQNGVTPYGTNPLDTSSLTNATPTNTLTNTNAVNYTPTSTSTSGGGTNALGLTPLQTAVAGTGVLSTLGSLGVNKAISNAANTQAQAGQNVQDVLGGFYNQYAQAQQPYQNLGTGAVQNITSQTPYLTHQFNAQDLQAGLAPNYDFMLQQGQGANRNLANVGGGLLSGNTLQGLNQFTQNYAGNAYQNAFNNYQTQRQNIYSNLSNAAGLGQTSLGQLGQVGSNLAQTYGNVTTGLAASQAGAQTAQAVNNANLLNNLAKTGTVLALA
jgi:hypothetical protein